MKIFHINRKNSLKSYTRHSNKFSRVFLENILLENQLQYLTRKYPDIDPEIIQQAIDFDRRSAEKLVFGLQKGIINSLNADSLAAVANIDPHAKISNKSEANLAYEEEIKSAKSINPIYWQWILRVRRANPKAVFDEGIFHYLEAENIKTEDIKDKSLEEINLESEKWHENQFKTQKTGGVYQLGPDSPEALEVPPYAWVPVYTADARVEGDKMQNCIGSYCRPSEDTLIFSLRNRFNNPHVSISLKKLYFRPVIRESRKSKTIEFLVL